MSELNQKEVNEQMYLFVKRWLDDLPFEESKKVPVMAIGYCLARLSKQDELLKGQEAVKPKYNARTNWFECGACHYSMTSGMHCRNELIPAYKVGFCAKCGRAVKWNG